MSIIISLLMFSFIVVIHEFGHYYAAVKNDILVEEFAIGMGPALYKKQGKDTLFTIRLFPIGGYCKMLGEDEDVYSDRSFNSKSVKQRAVVISAGVIMNFLLAFIVFLGFNAYFGYPVPIIGTVAEGYPADEIGLQPGDKILEIDGYNVSTYNDVTFALASVTDPNVHIKYTRDGQKYEDDIVLKLYKDEQTGLERYRIGFTPSYRSGIFEDSEYPKVSILGSIHESVYNIWFVVKSTVISLVRMITMNIGAENMSGPIGIIGGIGDSFDSSVKTSGIGVAILNMLYIAGFLSANLAVFNILPFPALDGGRLVFLAIEAVRGKPVDPEKEGRLHYIGFMALLVLAVFIAGNDIYKIIAK